MCTCLVEDKVCSLDDYDIMEKAINFTYVHSRNDGLVSIKDKNSDLVMQSIYTVFVVVSCMRMSWL